ncbi:hypothetical protein PCASD_25653 [Puccinia coronata f. sp. avenae]|uniref:Uncharacterized protein n=1 Tax=Puccinia coronata f. sp. avenae TaxID=200324 RepID=A0A2N5RXS1_9BASI|nr:hypothetical protein PCASD_25653 [Puccinia coronata f. sp. avenae]
MHWWYSGMAPALLVLERPMANDHCGAMSSIPGQSFGARLPCCFHHSRDRVDVKFPGESHDLSGGHHRHCLGACARKSQDPLDQLFFVLAPATKTLSQVPYPAIPAATALTVSPPLIQRSSRWLGERGELEVRLTVEQPVIQWWRVGAYRDTTAAHPPVVHRSPDGGPTRRSGLLLETCRTIGATVPTVEPGSFQRSYDPTVKPPL